jgi:hypothetical protein
VHVNGDKDSRVTESTFVAECEKFTPSVPAEKLDAYKQFSAALVDMAKVINPTKMVDHNGKHTFGKHSFGYISLMCAEFYGDKPSDRLQLAGDARPADQHQALREELDADWKAVEKDKDGRVGWDAFRDYYFSKYEDRVTDPTRKALFKMFIDKDFAAACSMMLPAEKQTLGGHCFRYAGLMAGEFHFDNLGHGQDVLKVL